MYEPITTLALTLVFAFGSVALLRYRGRRRRLYLELAADRAATLARHPVRIAAAENPAALHPAFQAERILRIGGFLAPDTLARLQVEGERNRARAERSFIPGHKKGGTLSYETLHRRAPAMVALYHSLELRAWLSALVGADLAAPADHDQSSCSLLCYDHGGDHIGWHYDHNFYRGRHFTVLISLRNRGQGGGLSAGRLEYRHNGEVVAVDTGENSLVIFEGARVRHRATEVAEGDQRVMLSMTFATDPRVGPGRELLRRVKDTAYYGPRVLFG
jgi:hypothetical protein